MKKKIASKDDLTKYALSRGASVAGADGTKFNTTKKKVARPVKKVEKKVEVEIEVEEKEEKPDLGSQLIAEKLDTLGAANKQMLQELAVQIGAIQLQAPAPPTEWMFDIIRDEQGFIQQIKATTPQKRLNS